MTRITQCIRKIQRTRRKYKTEAVRRPVSIFLRGASWRSRKRHTHAERRASEHRKSQIWYLNHRRRKERSPQSKQYVAQVQTTKGRKIEEIFGERNAQRRGFHSRNVQAGLDSNANKSYQGEEVKVNLNIDL